MKQQILAMAADQTVENYRKPTLRNSTTITKLLDQERRQGTRPRNAPDQEGAVMAFRNEIAHSRG